MAVVPPLPFAQSEIRSTPGRLLDRLFAGEDTVVGDDLMAIVLQGGYPEALRRLTADRRTAWLEFYVKLILDRDVREIANIDQLDRLPRLPEVLAEHAGQLVNHSSFGAALGLSSITAQKYVVILECLFLITCPMVQQPLEPARQDTKASFSGHRLACDFARRRRGCVT